MSKNKTTETTQSVEAFLSQVADELKRADSYRLVDIMQQETGFEAKMWGPNIVGFGSYHYKYDSGHEGDAPLAGFSPRAREFSLYLSPDAEEKRLLLQDLGKHRMAVSCIYVKKVSDMNEDVLRKMIRSSVKFLKGKYT